MLPAKKRNAEGFFGCSKFVSDPPKRPELCDKGSDANNFVRYGVQY